MLVPGSVNPLLLTSAAGAAAGGISRSLRFNSSDSAYLSRTPASAGNRRTWTFSCWVKRSKLGTLQYLLQSLGGGSYRGALYFETDDKLYFYLGNTSSNIYTTAVFRDVSAWYHVVVKIDTTQATQAAGMKLYVNGVEQVVTNVGTYTQNDEGWINSTNAHQISGTSSFYFDGYLADIYLLDGTATTPSTFAETDAITGQWMPKTPTGISYGTNGFRLTFSDNSGTSATTLGKDSAGSNNWTPNNFSVASGSGNDSLVDVPTNGSQTDTGVGGEVRGNYCTANPVATSSSLTLSNGNLQVVGGLVGSAEYRGNGTIGVSSGKWYFETTLVSAGNNTAIGIGQNNITTQYPGQDSLSYAFVFEPSKKINSNSQATYGSSLGAGDVFMCAFDLDNNKIFFGKNGTWFDSSVPASGTSPAYTLTAGTYLPIFRPQKDSGTCEVQFNFGQRAFAYTAPSGFKALNTANLPTPAVVKSNTAMDVVLYTGTGSSLTLPYASSTPTSIAFTPDLVWIKGRSGATDHALYDAVRDVQKDLVSNSIAAETTQSTGLTAFGTNTFTIGSLAKLNTSSATYAAWIWDAGSSTDPNNTAGSITSSVRANATAGFSVVTWSTNSSSGNATIGHGLNVAPKLIIMKSRNATYNWDIYHGGISNAKDGRLVFTTAAFTTSFVPFGGVDPTSTVFTMSQSFYGTGIDCVAYCFAPVVGYSSFGSYTGNGSSDGPFVYTGFRPRWLLIKNASVGSDSWQIWDAARSDYNAAQKYLLPNTSGAEGDNSAFAIDFTANGFKVRNTNTASNGSGNTLVYAAFAESPFNYARAR